MNDPVRVLHVDDPALTARTPTELRHPDVRFTVETATNVEEALARIDGVDCIVSGYDLSDRTGLDLLETVRDPDRPFVLWSGVGSEAVASEAIAAGVTDYLPRRDDPEWRRLADRVLDAVPDGGVERPGPDYRALFEHNPDGIVVRESDGSFVEMNDAYADLFGYDRETLLVAGFEAIHPDNSIHTPARAREQLREALDSGSQTFEWPGVTSGGERIWTEVNLTPIRFDGVERVLATVREVTERKERERELREAKTQLESAIEAGAVGTWQWRIDEDRVVVDRAFAETFGIDPDAAAAGVPIDRFLDSIHEADGDQVERAIEAALDDCGDYAEEFRVRTTDGNRRWLVARGSVECDDAGEPVTFPGTVTDITERKAYERRLERQNERLETFPSVVSHDLRNPLTVAQGRLELARRVCRCDCDEFDAIDRAHSRMRTLIDDLLALARQGETVDATAPVELESLVRTCWRTVDTRGAELIVDASSTVEADRSRLQQLLENLIRNAVEHGSRSSRPEADDGAASETSRATDDPGDGDEAIRLPSERDDFTRGPATDRPTVTITVGDLPDGFYVADDGPGIPESEQDVVFQAGHTTHADGTGFGLSIVERIAEAHGWMVTVTESDAGGARFEITGVTLVDDDGAADS